MRVVVLGATGSVGRAILQILAERSFPAQEVIPLGSSQSKGRHISMGDRTLTVQEADTFDWAGTDLVFSATHAEVAQRLLPRALQAGSRVVDKSSAFRMEATVPLVVPEVNRHVLKNNPPLVASPNCVVIPLVISLASLHAEAGVRRIVLSTYQSVSGAGKKGMDELHSQTRDLLMAGRPEAAFFSKPIAFNLIPQIGDFNADGVSQEEEKIQEETQKILKTVEGRGGESPIGMAVTAVRVPVFIGHSMSVCVALEEPVSLSDAQRFFAHTPGLSLFHRGRSVVSPLEVVGEDDVFVSRLRKDPSVENGLIFWLSCDNLRKGAALNAVQIAEEMLPEACARRERALC